MTNDNIEETVEPTQEETHEETTEPQQEDDSQIKTMEDYNKLAARAKTLEIQRAKAIAKVRELEVLKKQETLTKEVLVTREESFLIAKGYTLEELDLVNKVAKINNVSLMDATNDDYVKTKVESRLRAEKSERASLAPSNGSLSVKGDKRQGEMTRDEHRAYFEKVISMT